MRHNKNCDWTVQSGVAYCPKCMQPVIPEDLVPDGPAPASTSAGEAVIDGALSAPAAAAIACPACGRQVDAGLSVCPWDGEPLLPQAAAGTDGAPWVVVPGGYQATLVAQPLVLGRLSDDGRIASALDADGVSRRHAELRLDAGVVWLRDLRSTNGTWLGARRIDTDVRLPPGDSEIGLGQNVKVTVHVP